MELSPKQTHHLRSLCHHLRPVVIIGSAGTTPRVLEEIENALAHHELIKIKIAPGDRDTRRQIALDICRSMHAHLIQMIGHVATLYRPGRVPRINQTP